MSRHPKPPAHNIHGRAGNGNCARAVELWDHGKGMKIQAIADLLGIRYRTVTSYIQRGTALYSSQPRDKTPRCRCCLRLSTPDELAQGHCSDCLPTNAVAYLGRSGRLPCARWACARSGGNECSTRTA